MIQAELIFPLSEQRELLRTILHLPGRLQPTRMSLGEDEAGSMISDDLQSLEKLISQRGGYFLKNKDCSYDLNINVDMPIKLSCFLDVPASSISLLLTQLATNSPLFGFACLPEERETKNKVINKIGVNTIESWVGRNIEKALPGLYWWTLLSPSLAEKHGIPLAALAGAAREHVEGPGAVHLFRFYERPEDWRDAAAVDELTSKCPGIFNVEIAREMTGQAKTWLEVSEIARRWR